VVRHIFQFLTYSDVKTLENYTVSSFTIKLKYLNLFDYS
jgi:hypothetical protein